MGLPLRKGSGGFGGIVGGVGREDGMLDGRDEHRLIEHQQNAPGAAQSATLYRLPPGIETASPYSPSVG